MYIAKSVFKAIVALGLVAQVDGASAAALRCDSCTDQDMLEAAIFAGDGYHQVYDVQGERLRYVAVGGWGWQPITFPAPEGVQGHWLPVPAEDEVWFVEIAAHLKSRMYPSGHDADFAFDELAVGYVGATAAEAVRSFTLADRIYQRLLSSEFAVRHAGLLRFAQIVGSGAARTLISRLGIGEGMAFRVRITFQNGSSVILNIGPESAEIIRAETAEGAPIPIPGTHAFYEGQWEGANLNYLRSHMDMFFARTSSAIGGGCANPVVTRVVCETRNETGVHCTYTLECND